MHAPTNPPPPFRGCVSQYWYIQMRSPVNDLNGIANAAMTGVSQRIDVVIGSFEMCFVWTYLFVCFMSIVFYVMLFYFVFEGIV